MLTEPRVAWRRGALLLAGVVVLVSLGVRTLRPRPAGRRVALSTDGIALVPDVKGMEFFQDHVYDVHLHRSEGAQYPIRLVVFYQGTGVPLAPAEVQRAITTAIEGRTGARWTVDGSLTARQVMTPSVVIAIDLWRGGGMRSDVILHCRGPGTSAFAPGVFDPGRDAQYVTSSSRGALAGADALVRRVGEELSAAAALRCPATLPEVRQETAVIVLPSRLNERPKRRVP